MIIIFDFDGTLFNTLPVYFDIKRNRISSQRDVLFWHKQFINRRRASLGEYAEEWKFLFKRCDGQQIYIISESPHQVLIFYLDTFGLKPYVSGLFGQQLSQDGSRYRTIEKLLLTRKLAWLISDNPLDLLLRYTTLNIIDARGFYSGGISVFRQKLVNLEKTIFGNCTAVSV
ncbi:MAG: hypothetical protein C5B47_02405 [Verrucomicrobia bacterium]|nr:MAG: hypothetical protein C5B47_02405 [Verrucomicrobiota bacterium]